MATVSHIFIAAEARVAVQDVARVRATAQVGLEGDRYAAGRGSWSDTRDAPRDVTLISARDIAEANAQLEVPFTFAETRRNLVISGDVDLLDLIGKEFSVGDIRMRGIEEAAPCTLPPRLANKRGFIEAFAKRAGIRATLLSSGEINVGDVLQVSAAAETPRGNEIR